MVRAIEEEILTIFSDERRNIRIEAKEVIQKAQTENKKNYNKRRKSHAEYQMFDLVAIKQAQFVAGKKLSNKYIGPYKIVKVKRNGRYDVEKAADFEGPRQASTSVENIKLWKYVE